jgi:hypothetical protein
MQTSYFKHDLSTTTSGNISIPLGTATQAEPNYVFLYNNVALTGGLTVTDDGTPVEGTLFVVNVQGVITVGAFSVTIFGQAVSGAYLGGNTTILAYFDGTNYQVSVMPSFLVAQIVSNANIANATIALSKLALGSAGSVIQYNASGVPTATALSGDFTLSNTGVGTIANSAVTAAKIASDAVTTAKILDANVTLAKLEASLQAYFGTPNTILYEEVTILSAAIKTGSTVPIVLVGAVAGKTILPLYVIEQMTYGTTPYGTNGITEIKHDGATDPIFSTTANGFLFGTVSKSILMTLLAPTAATDTQLLVNADLLWTVNGGDPTAGDSNITVKVGYVLI